jgi:hypothetical protein
VAEDPDLSDEGKEKKIADIHNRLGPKIERDAQNAREKAQKLAKQYAERAIPMPGGSMAGSSIKDAAELSAIQNEAATIAEQAKSGNLADKIQARTGKRPKNISDGSNRTLDNLQAFYGEALEGSGFEAKIQAHATLRAAQKLGIHPEAVYEPFMEDRHKDALEESLHYFTAANMIDTSAPSAKRGRVGGGHHWKRAGTPRTSAGGTLFPKKKTRPPWK